MTSLVDPLPTLAASTHRALGAYYTPSVAVESLVRWTLRNPGDRVLEPSMGDGAFLAGLARESERRRLDAEVWGVEMAADTFASTVTDGLVQPHRALRRDFLEVDPFEVDAVIGNPPYVRLRHLPANEAARALRLSAAVLGEPMDPSGSIWMPFVLHAAQFLSRGGRMAYVLPFDLTYVRYARPLWSFLGRHFGSLRVVRVHERMFPEILQEVVLLFADDFGGTTTEVTFEAYRTLDQLATGAADVRAALQLGDVVSGNRVFLEALMPTSARSLLHQGLAQQLIPAREVVTFNVGYVCGDKGFFHPDATVIERHSMPRSSLRTTLTSSRQLTGGGLHTSSLAPGRHDQLFLPPMDGALTDGEQAYVDLGTDAGVSQRYKCRIREPWYVTPGVRVPDVVVPVFTERPALVVNDAGMVASNSLLCGHLRSGTADALACAWYTSLTLLQLEMEVHSLGGGVMVLVPREAGSLRLPRLARSLGDDHLARIHGALVAGDTDGAFTTGDQPVLQAMLGLSPHDVSSIRAAADELAFWRTSARRGTITGRSSSESDPLVSKSPVVGCP